MTRLGPHGPNHDTITALSAHHEVNEWRDHRRKKKARLAPESLSTEEIGAEGRIIG